ncbi:MAG TPA: histidine phosphatase family protein [Actinomycetota bacterium]|nr:histidine phosphatase family protein [Actinomycetota bacterium]
MTIWLVRHGETEWSLTGRHTGSTDIPLTQQGRLQAVAIGKLLSGRRFDHVFSSPMGRAVQTGTLAGFGERIRVDERLCEFDYGEFEGKTTVEIWATHPGWEIFRDGCPGGETPEQMSKRADALLEELRELEGNVLLFGHGHCFRAIAARFLDLPIGSATGLQLDAGTISAVGDGRDGPALLLWNRRVSPQAMVVADIAAAIADAVP